MTEISPLRRRMTEDMTVRNLSPATQQSYISGVSKFSRFFGQSPDQLTLEDVRTFQVHLVAKGISWPGLNQIVCALRVTAWAAFPRSDKALKGGGSATGGTTHTESAHQSDSPARHTRCSFLRLNVWWPFFR